MYTSNIFKIPRKLHDFVNRKRVCEGKINKIIQYDT